MQIILAKYISKYIGERCDARERARPSSIRNSQRAAYPRKARRVLINLVRSRPAEKRKRTMEWEEGTTTTTTTPRENEQRGAGGERNEQDGPRRTRRARELFFPRLRSFYVRFRVSFSFCFAFFFCYSFVARICEKLSPFCVCDNWLDEDYGDVSRFSAIICEMVFYIFSSEI